MDLFDVAQACRRRWYVTVPLAVLTLAIAGLAFLAVPTVYRATTVVGLAPSPVSGGEGNGIINNGGTIMLANLTAAGIASPIIAQEITDSTGATEFAAAVVAVPGGQMPMLNLTASAHNLDTAISAVTISQQLAHDELNRIQANAGISERAYGVIYQVSGTPDVEVLRPGRMKLVVGIVGLGLIVSVLAGLLWDLRKIGRQREGLTAGNESAAAGAEAVGVEQGGVTADQFDDRARESVRESASDLPDHKSGTLDVPTELRLEGQSDERGDLRVRGLADGDVLADTETLAPRPPAKTERGGDATSRHQL